MEVPALYKYLPSRYVDAVMEEGLLLFRSLTYFRQIGGEVRGDDLEGLHMDSPDDGFDVILEDGRKLKGKRFTNSINPEQVYAFCMSTKLEKALFDEFECDTCIEVQDVESFLHRCVNTIEEIDDVDQCNYGPVEYYKFDEKTDRDIKDPTNIPLFKHIEYSGQEEFRVYFAVGDGLELEQKVVIEGNPFNLPDEDTSEKSDPVISEREIRIGSLQSIASVIHRDSVE